ncbi:MAG: D-amino acid dehydrogenase [Wenzhouxiangella sp.]|nr:D-amino acid dehydrogenase [Wenzhouxiangella sp.]TVR98801.1 MAG: FAD-dependent oxidoreductase [Wenzhouxiangellaceae bacterium]
MSLHVIVIGAGVVGASTALSLAERGLTVTVLDRQPQAAAETSHANGGGITPGHAEPWNAPGIIQRLLTRSGTGEPFRIHAHALPGLIGWGINFLWQSKASRYYLNAQNNTRLAVYSGQCLKRLRERHQLSYHQYTDGSLELYFSQSELDHALDLRRMIGDPRVEIRVIDADEVVAMEPALEPVAGRLAGAMFLPLHESGDACVFSAEMLRCAKQLGTEIRLGANVERIERHQGRVIGVRLQDKQLLEADAVIVAAGCGSPALVKPLGLKLPIYPVKGYSATLELEQAELAPTIPLLDLEHRIVTARFGNRLRMAGLADFDGYNRTIRSDRIQVLLDSACALLPRLADEIRAGRAESWAGLRPMTPRGTPLLGPTRIPGLYLNAGHGSMGWTQAAGSAEVLADILTDRSPAIELGPFAA